MEGRGGARLSVKDLCHIIQDVFRTLEIVLKHLGRDVIGIDGYKPDVELQRAPGLGHAQREASATGEEVNRANAAPTSRDGRAVLET